MIVRFQNVLGVELKRLFFRVQVELVVTLDSLSTWGGNVASHGSSYSHDSHVPVIFFGMGIRPGRYGDFVRTVDIAPTLAKELGLEPAEKLDGKVLVLEEHSKK